MTAQSNSVQSGTARSVALIRSWPLTLFCGLLLPLLLSLGFWQLDRAGQKAAMVAALDARLSAQPVAPEKLPKLERYVPLRLLGYYTDELFYLDNRTRSGRVGYEIVQVFVSAGQRWLINRGWVEATNSRQRLPQVSSPMAAKVITGFLYPLPEALARSADESAKPQQRIQSLDTGLGTALGLQHPHWSVRLSADSDTALVTDWKMINSPPERHRAYAFQWFAMAAALVLLWLAAATRILQRLRVRRVQRQ
ncbi:SURF1 family protein [Microbulbifer sp. 2201CG32-9]|uniref:SURF1 family protein n=1 Tax=Microbulbifer sp. 2201CG32-9 TaxID=3232309 RepID=UPI00345B7195